MECQVPQIDTQPVLQVSHRIVYIHVCTGHYGKWRSGISTASVPYTCNLLIHG